MLPKLLAAIVPIALSAAAARAEIRVVYVGTYTGEESKGIYGFALDTETGALEPLGLLAETPSPSFLALHPDGEHLYAVNEVAEGMVSAFRIVADGRGLEPLNRQSTNGASPCHLTVDASGRNVLFANYGGGSVGVIRIEDDGSLGARTAFLQHAGSSVNPRRPSAPHAHCITLDPSNRIALAADLGVDKVFAYAFDAESGTLAPAERPFAKLAPGSGPRHVAFHPGGRRVYVINELLSTITGFRFDPATGGMEEIATVSTVPADFRGENSTAEIFAHPGGRFLYGSNRGHDSIAVFAIDEATGTLDPVQHSTSGGEIPRNFAIDEGGDFLLCANQQSGEIHVFRINPLNGRLSSTAKSARLDKPVCIVFGPKP